MTVFQVFSQFKRDLIVQQTKEGLNSVTIYRYLKQEQPNI